MLRSCILGQSSELRKSASLASSGEAGRAVQSFVKSSDFCPEI